VDRRAHSPIHAEQPNALAIHALVAAETRHEPRALALRAKRPNAASKPSSDVDTSAVRIAASPYAVAMQPTLRECRWSKVRSGRMSDLWFTVGVPATVAVATALYTAGGRAALARRAIMQELEIAKMLPDSKGRDILNRMAEEKSVLYASRWIGPQPLSPRDHVVWLSIVLVGSVVTWSAGKVLAHESGHPWISSGLLLVMFFAMAAAAAGVASWISLMWMADNAKTRTQIIRSREDRVERHLNPAPGPDVERTKYPPRDPAARLGERR
jgi:hypothetical protein